MPISDLVFGASSNGVVTAVLPDTLVVRCTVHGFLDNVRQNRAWEASVGVKHLKRLDDT